MRLDLTPAAAAMRLALAVVLATASLPLAAQEAPAPPPPPPAPLPAGSTGAFAIVDVTVLPMDAERVLPGQTVIVRDGRIVAVGSAASTAVPSDAQRIDGRGRYLMPGLAEMHAHVPGANASDAQLRELMFLYVANGVTTIRGMLGAPSQLQLRERLASGEILGPTFFVGAPSLSGNTASDPAAAAQQVRAHKLAGYDFLKLHPGLTRPVYDAVVETANEVGITFAGHISAPVGLARTLEAGQTTIDHLDGYVEALIPDSLRARMEAGPVPFGEILRGTHPTDGQIRALAAATREAGVWNVPTALLWESFFAPIAPESLVARPEMRYVSQATVNGWAQQKRGRIQMDAQNGLTPELAAHYLDIRRRVLKALADEGAGLLMGTDSPQMFNVPGFALHREVALMVDVGISPYMVLESGTRNVARYAHETLGVPDDFGRVAEGMRADLVLLEANPLEDIGNLQRRAGVMVKGRWLTEEEIRRALEAIAARHNP